MSLKKISERLDEKQRKIYISTQNILQNKDSALFCDECKNRLGIFRMLRYAFKKKKHESYYVLCKKCNFVNVRVKGEIGKNIDDFWSKHGV
jgi:RNase P subunit RPR2